MPTPDTIIAYSTLFLAAVTAALAFFTFKLWSATGKLVKSSQDAARSQLRAYVFVREFSAQEVPSSDSGLANNWRITVVWENGGNTPTKNLLNSINWRAFEQPMPHDFDFPDRPHSAPSVGLIGPRSVKHSDHVDIPLPILDHVAHGRQLVYIWGWVDYDDVVGGTSRHRTEFCFEVLKHAALMSFRPWRKFNGADNDCLRAPAEYQN